MFLWQSESLSGLAELRGRLPHALLLHGREGVGQLELALDFARFLLCAEAGPGGVACGRCEACGWFELGNHPDFRLLQPDSMAPEDADGEKPAEANKKKSDQIRVDQVRDLQRFLSVGTHRAGLRVIVLHPADSMNVSTQNALLKSLEEPPPGTLFMLVTSQPHRLLPTVRSRCQSMPVPVPDREGAVAWLKAAGVENAESLLALSGGAPLSAVALAASEQARRRVIGQLGDPDFDPVAAAECCLAAEPSAVVGWMQRWVYDLLSLNLAGVLRYHVDEGEAARAVAARCDPARTAALLRRLAEARGLAQHPLNTRLFFEDLLVDYGALLGSRSA